MVQNNLDDFQYMGIEMLSKYLLLKTSTIYSLVGKRKIPFYKIGRLVRFKKSEIDAWMEDHRKECIDVSKEARKVLKLAAGPGKDIQRVVKKAIEQSKRIDYTASHGKPDQVKGLGKEVLDGSV